MELPVLFNLCSDLFGDRYTTDFGYYVPMVDVSTLNTKKNDMVDTQAKRSRQITDRTQRFYSSSSGNQTSTMSPACDSTPSSEASG